MEWPRSTIRMAIAFFVACYVLGGYFLGNIPKAYAVEEGASLNNLKAKLTAASEEDNITEGWTRLGACEWQVSGDGVLTIRPAGNGGEGTLSSTTSSTWGDKRGSIKKAVIAPGVKAGASTEWMFYCPNLEEVEGLGNLDTSNTTDMSAMFHSSKVRSVDLTGLDTSKVTGMRAMFEECRDLESVNLEGLNTSSLRTAYNMFNATGNFVISWDGFDLSNVDANNMFYASKIESIDFSKVKTNSSTNLYGAFCDCHQLKTANMAGMNGSDYGYLLAFCENLTDVDFTGANFNRQSQYYMLYGCNSLTEIPNGFRFTGSGQSPFLATGETLITNYEGCDSGIIDHDWNSENRILKTTIQHNWDDGKITREPTCTTEGVKTFTCNRCKTTRAEAIEATGHAFTDEYTVDKPATCTGAGSESIHCTVCGEQKPDSARAIAKLGHDLKKVECKEATCTAKGNVEHFECKRCGELFRDQDAKQAVSSDEITIAAKGHAWGGWQVTKPAACTEDGVETHKCENDASHTETRALKATGHAWDAGVVTKAATYDAAGVRTYTCGKCKDTRTETVPKLARASLTKATVSVPAKLAYTGKKIAPNPTVRIGGKTLVKGADYTVSYSANVNAGKVTVTVTGKGAYAGSKKTAFTITQAANKATAKSTSVKKSVKLADLKKKAKTIALPKVTTKFGKAKWKVTAKDKKKVLNLKNGKVQVKRGTKAGTYTMKLKASVAKTQNYKAASTKVVTVKVTVASGKVKTNGKLVAAKL